MMGKFIVYTQCLILIRILNKKGKDGQIMQQIDEYCM
jgi:hypothetical protein